MGSGTVSERRAIKAADVYRQLCDLVGIDPDRKIKSITVYLDMDSLVEVSTVEWATTTDKRSDAQ